MNLIELKALAAVVCLLLALFFGLAPLVLLQRYAWSDGGKSQHPLLHLLHSLALGVLLATCLLNLLPESLQTVRDALKSAHSDPPYLRQESYGNVSSPGFFPGLDKSREDDTVDNDGMYPVAELMVALGFLFIFILDSTIKTWQALEKHEDGNETELNDLPVEWGEDNRGAEDFAGDQSHALWNWHPKQTLLTNGDHNYNVGRLDDNNDGEGSEHSLRQISKFRESSPKNFSESNEAHPLADERQTVRSDTPVSRVMSIALVSALCVHGFFDGVILGLQTSRHVLLSLLLALSIHKCFVAVSLSLTLASNQQQQQRQQQRLRDSRLVAAEMLYILLFAAMAPLGLALSSVFMHTAFDLDRGDHSNGSARDVSVIPGCLQAFAAGTFMYVAFSELTEHARREHNHGCKERRRHKFLRVSMGHVFLAVGFTFMACMRAALGDP